MDGNPYYGRLAKTPTFRLRQVMNELQIRGYLAVTVDEYAVVKLTELGKTLLNGEGSVEMKLAKEAERQPKAEKKGRKKTAAAGLSQADESLFERLRALRMEIAREEKVPPYIVFSDKTLLHMSAVKPADREEMLSVTGVGEFKFSRYGERFLAEIGKWRIDAAKEPVYD